MRHNYLLGLKQSDFEPMLANGWKDLACISCARREPCGARGGRQRCRRRGLYGTRPRASDLSDAMWDEAPSEGRWNRLCRIRSVDELHHRRGGDGRNPVSGTARGRGIGEVDPASRRWRRHRSEQAPCRSDRHPMLRPTSRRDDRAYGTDSGVHSPTRICISWTFSRQAVEHRRAGAACRRRCQIDAPLAGQG